MKYEKLYGLKAFKPFQNLFVNNPRFLWNNLKTVHFSMRVSGGKRKTMSMLDFWVILKLSIAKPCKVFHVNMEWCPGVFTSTWHAATAFIFEVSLVIESLNERTSIYLCDQLKKEFWLFYQAFPLSEPQLQHLLLPKMPFLFVKSIDFIKVFSIHSIDVK